MSGILHRSLWRFVVVLMALLLGWCYFGGSAAGEEVRLNHVWDLTGSYSGELDGEYGFDYSVVHDSKGKFHGSGHWEWSDWELGLVVEMQVKGKVKTTPDGSTSVVMVMKHSGVATYWGESYRFKATQKVVARIDPDALVISGMVTTKLSAHGAKMGPIDEYFEEQLMDDMDGSAVLEMAFAEDDRGRVSGSATCTLSNGVELAFSLKGKHKQEVVKLTLKGEKLAQSAGCSFKLMVADGPGGPVEDLKAKVMGQKLDVRSVVP